MTASPKPKSVRLAILSALARNGITTLDDLQTQTGEARKKLQDHTMHAINLKLITRTQDDVTHQPAYKITPEGRKYLATYAHGDAAEPTTGNRDANREKSEAVALRVLEDVMPGFSAEAVAQKDAEIADLTRQLGVEKVAHAAILEALSLSDAPLAPPVDQIEFLNKSRNLARTKAKELEKRLADHDATVKQLASWQSMAKVFGCSTPEQVADRISGLSASPKFEIVGHVIERPAKVLTRVNKFDRAKQRSLALSRKDGKKARLYGMVLLGVAQPGAEWKEV